MPKKTKPIEKYTLTDEHRAQLKPWADDLCQCVIEEMADAEA